MIRGNAHAAVHLRMINEFLELVYLRKYMPIFYFYNTSDHIWLTHQITAQRARLFSTSRKGQKVYLCLCERHSGPNIAMKKKPF
jgi:hypothetical protein